MNDLKKVLEEAEIYASKKIINYPEKIVYHNLKFAKRIQSYVEKIATEISLSDDEMLLSKISAWLFTSSFDNHIVKFSMEGGIESNIIANSIANAKEFFELSPIEPKLEKVAFTALGEMFFPKVPETKIGMLLHDTITADLVMGNGKKHLKKVYEEMMLHDVTISKKKWFDVTISMAKSLKFYLPYCEEHFQPLLLELQGSLAKEKKNLEKNSDLALKRELDISDQELKQLKKNLDESKGRDGRGIQTVFRTTSKNHYTLNQMVDRKASIMITVNSIILSLVLGGIIGSQPQDFALEHLPILLLTLTSIGSIIFAILSITPVITHGQFTEDDIRNKKGNLLYYGNFHDMHLRDFEWGFLEMMNDQEYLYSSMVKDIYYLGLTLKKKFSNIRVSLTIFLIGLTLSVASFLFVSFFDCI